MLKQISLDHFGTLPHCFGTQPHHFGTLNDHSGTLYSHFGSLPFCFGTQTPISLPYLWFWDPIQLYWDPTLLTWILSMGSLESLSAGLPIFISDCLQKFRKFVRWAADLYLGEQIREDEYCCQEGKTCSDRRDVQTTVKNQSKVFCLGLRCLWRQQKGG